MQVRPVVIYHGDCVDGATAAAVCYLKFGTWADYVPAGYQRPLSDFLSLDRALGAEVFIVDFSFPSEELITLADVAAKVTVIDHHEKKYKDHLAGISHPRIEVVFDNSKSGASLAWRCFFPERPEPEAIRYAEDYDLWLHKMEGDREVHAYFYSLLGHPDGEVLTYALHLYQPAPGDRSGADWIREGKAIFRANRQQVMKIARHPELVRFAGIEALAVNSPVHANEIGDYLGETSPSGLAITWSYSRGRYKVSLRFRPRDGVPAANCAEVAALFGGGGHRGAAGFDCDELPWRCAKTEAANRERDEILELGAR